MKFIHTLEQICVSFFSIILYGSVLLFKKILNIILELKGKENTDIYVNCFYIFKWGRIFLGNAQRKLEKNCTELNFNIWLLKY